MRRVESLDGLRGLSAVAVILSHTIHQPELGPLGVEVFFVLSGFLVGGIILDSMDEPGWLTRFYLRRTARIWPLYYLVMALTMAVHGPGLVPWWTIPTFTTNWADLRGHGPPNILFMFWSVAIEEWWYLLAPLFLSRIRRSQIPFGLLAIAFASVCARLVVSRYSPALAYVLNPCRLDGLALGTLAAWSIRHRRSWAEKLWPYALLLTVLRLAALGHPTWYVTGTVNVFGWEMLGSTAAATLILSLVTNRLPYVSRLLAWGPFVYCGHVSYGLYALHPLIVEGCERLGLTTPGLTLLVPAFGLTLAAATLSWQLLERPILSLSRSSLAQPVPGT